MSVPTVELSGRAVTGVRPPALPGRPAASVPMLPTKVKLGRRPPKHRGDVPALADFLNLSEAPKPPTAVAWHVKAVKSIGQGYGNFDYGDCVIAGKMHAVGSWTANDSDSGGEVIGTDTEALDQYRRICGPGDDGCVITDVLDAMTRDGLTVGGRAHKIDGYATVHAVDMLACKVAMHLFGGVTIGVNLPAAWLQSDVWDQTATRIVGGHDVECLGYDQTGVYVASWGRLYRITWRAWTDPRFLEECYVKLAPDWSGADNVAASGIDVEGLRAALAEYQAGTTPDDPTPPPEPPVPPVPPVPPEPVNVIFDVSGEIHRGQRGHPDTFVGSAFPRKEQKWGDEVEIETAHDSVAAGVRDAVEGFAGIVAYRAGHRLKLRREGLTPDQWAALLSAVMAFVEALTKLWGAAQGTPAGGAMENRHGGHAEGNGEPE